MPTIFGFINCEELNVLCALGKPALNELTLRVNELLPDLERPFFALTVILNKVYFIIHAFKE